MNLRADHIAGAARSSPAIEGAPPHDEEPDLAGRPLAVFVASRTRLAVLKYCVQRGTVSTQDVVANVDVSISGARKHLQALADAGVVTMMKRPLPGARWRFAWSVDIDAIRDAIDDLDVLLSPSSD